MFKLHVLASGSKGNASVVENTRSGRCILVDCGISKRDFLSRCDDVSLDPAQITDILVTHEHTDHTKGLGVVVRGLEKRGVELQLRTSRSIKEASPEIIDALKSDNVVFAPFKSDETIDLHDVVVSPFLTSHDAAQSFGFRFESQASASAQSDCLAYLTDSGYMTEEALQALQFARIVAIESNHDYDMLMGGAYPYMLKKRISSKQGHLSNTQAASALDEHLCSLGGTSLEQVVAMHISQENNTYDLPLVKLGEVLERYAHSASVTVSYQAHAVSVG